MKRDGLIIDVGVGKTLGGSAGLRIHQVCQACGRFMKSSGMQESASCTCKFAALGVGWSEDKLWR